MGCPKLTYHPEFLHLYKEAALEKSDHENGWPHGKKYAGEKNCIDYYPFGLRFNSYTRENAVPNKTKLFQGQEHIDDLGLNWDSFKWRNHQPEIGRFFNVDKLSEKYYYNSPYAFSENKVTSHIELEGLEAVGMDVLFTVAKYAASSRVEKISQASGQLVSGKSGYIPSNVNVDSETRQMVKIGTTVQNANTIIKETTGLVMDAAKAGAEGGKDIGDKTQKAGIILSAVGLPEVGVPLAAVGSAVEAGATAVSAALNVSEGNYGEALMDTGGLLLDRQASKVLKDVTNAQGIGEQGRNILEANKEVVKEVGKAVIDQTKKKN